MIYQVLLLKIMIYPLPRSNLLWWLASPSVYIVVLIVTILVQIFTEDGYEYVDTRIQTNQIFTGDGYEYVDTRIRTNQLRILIVIFVTTELVVPVSL